MKKRNIAVIGLALMMLTASSFGCSRNKGNKGDETLENGVVNINLNKAGYGTGWINDAIDGFQKEYKIKVKVTETLELSTELSSLLNQKVKNKNAKIEVDDLYFASLQPSDWLQWTDYGKCVLEPLEDLQCVSRLDPDIKAWGSRTLYTQTGEETHLYAIHPNMAFETFIYNQNYLDQIDSYGAYTKGEWPVTWQGLLDLCTQLVVNMDGKIGTKTVYPYAMFLETDFEPYKLYETLFAQGNGGEDYRNYWNLEFYNEVAGEEEKSVFVNDSLVDAMWALDEFLKVDQLKGTNPKYYKLYEGAGDSSSGDVQALKGFLQGEALFCWHGSFFETEAKELINSRVLNKIGDVYSMGVVPAISGNEKDRTMNLNWPHENIVVPNFAPNKDNAKLFLDYIYRDANLINIVKTMNAVPGFTHTYTAQEKAKLTRWGQEIIANYEKFSDKTTYANGISFRNSTSRAYRGALLNSINFNNVGEGIFFPYLHCTNAQYNKSSKAEYKIMLENSFNGIKNSKWDEWIDRYPVYEKE